MLRSIFEESCHPFVWTTGDQREEVLANVNEPVWHRFLEESEKFFFETGGLRSPSFPVFCHDGDLDEVMAVAVLAYVRNERRYWGWIADWLRGMLSYAQGAIPLWRSHLIAQMEGGNLSDGNPRQFFEGLTRDGRYWVEAGLMSVAMHLLDLLAAYAPDEIADSTMKGLLAVVADFATRYAFHEEALKYSNRGIWANAGVLLAALASADPRTGALLRHQAARRHEELRSTFFDDGFHAEGASDYHLMALDGLLSYALTASRLDGNTRCFEAMNGNSLFQKSPGFATSVKAYLRTVIPGSTPMNNPRGCSVAIPVVMRPALVYAWKLTGDPEIGWLLRERMNAEVSDSSTRLRVRNSALLGLGHYQPLMNFWLFRPIREFRPPGRTLDILPDHGAVFSRSGWDAKASCVTARFGFEGTGKGHRDHGHVTVSVGGTGILKDPFPRFGPPGLESSLFHNTVTLDRHEPGAVIGSLQCQKSIPHVDAFLVSNTGGIRPDRAFLADPREESNYWFTQQPEIPDFEFQRAVFHHHNRCVVIVDRLRRQKAGLSDWFFHSALCPGGYVATAPETSEIYRLRQRMVIKQAESLKVIFRGEAGYVSPGDRRTVQLGDAGPGAKLMILPLECPVQIDMGHYCMERTRLGDGITFPAESDYYIRGRTTTSLAQMVWVLTWGREGDPVNVRQTAQGIAIQSTGWHGLVNFSEGGVDVSRL